MKLYALWEIRFIWYQLGKHNPSHILLQSFFFLKSFMVPPHQTSIQNFNFSPSN